MRVIVRQYAKTGEFIDEYYGLRRAAEAVGVPYIVHIGKCSRRKDGYFSAHGYVWRYSHDDDLYDLSLEERRAKIADLLVQERTHVRQYTLDGVFVAEYKSAAVAQRALGLHSCNISATCRREKGHRQCAGFIWRYPDDDEFAKPEG